MDFFQVPLGKEKDSLDKAYANAGYDQAVQNLINDIVFYKLSSDNIKDAYNNGEAPIRRADDLANSYGHSGLFGRRMENYSSPISTDSTEKQQEPRIGFMRRRFNYIRNKFSKVSHIERT